MINYLSCVFRFGFIKLCCSDKTLISGIMDTSVILIGLINGTINVMSSRAPFYNAIISSSKDYKLQ